MRASLSRFHRFTAARAVTLAMALGLGVAHPALIGGAPAVAHGTHYNCELHDFRPYPHRHIDPGAAVVNCERSAQLGRFSTAAICDAHALRPGQGDRIVDGTFMSSAVPIRESDNAVVRASALNIACDEALAACESAALGVRAQCEIVDQRFTQ
ncbi:MAG: hypothetical protein AAF909_13165 [Pseudomonadota bacterium]